MPAPTVTVVVPAFNALEWIGTTLVSIFDQTYPRDRLEIVVVDDGSTDDTASQAERLLGTSGISHAVLRHPASLGPSAARNRGWRHGRGEWIQFLDADDLIAPRKIELQSRVAHEADPRVAAVFSRWTRLRLQEGRWLADQSTIEPSIGEDSVLDLIGTDNFIATGSQLFRRKWIEHVGGYIESYHFIEDVDLLLRLAIQGGLLQLVPSAEPLFWYRQHPGSLSRSNSRAFVDGCLRNALLAEQFWRESDMLTTERASVLAGVCSMGMRYYAEHDPAVFWSLERDIRRLKPDFVPDHPRALRLLSHVVGYPRAEQCAVQWRRLKRSLRPSLIGTQAP